MACAGHIGNAVDTQWQRCERAIPNAAESFLDVGRVSLTTSPALAQSPTSSTWDARKVESSTSRSIHHEPITMALRGPTGPPFTQGL